MAVGRGVDRLTYMRKFASALAVVLVAISCACRDSILEIATSTTEKRDGSFSIFVKFCKASSSFAGRHSQFASDYHIGIASFIDSGDARIMR